MNNSFHRLIDGMTATLRAEVLSRLDDEFARGQVFGVINLLNTFKARADWSSAFLLQQIAAQQQGIDDAAALLRHSVAASAAELPELPAPALDPTPIASLLALRDTNNRGIADLLSWMDAHRHSLDDSTIAQAESSLRRAMRAEVDLELKNSPRPLFAEMSSGQER
jgi:hypothetical protein